MNPLVWSKPQCMLSLPIAPNSGSLTVVSKKLILSICNSHLTLIDLWCWLVVTHFHSLRQLVYLEAYLEIAMRLYLYSFLQEYNDPPTFNFTVVHLIPSSSHNRQISDTLSIVFCLILFKFLLAHLIATSNAVFVKRSTPPPRQPLPVVQFG